MSTEIRKASTTPILYNGANAVYAEVTTIRGVQRLITTIDRLWELSNRNDHFIRIEDHGRMVECHIERMHERALNLYTRTCGWVGYPGKCGPVLASENPSVIKNGDISYSVSPRAFDGTLVMPDDSDYAQREFGMCIGHIIASGSIEDEYIVYPCSGMPTLFPDWYIDSDMETVGGNDGEYRIYGKRLHHFCTTKFPIDTNPYTKMLPERILHTNTHFAQGLIDQLIREYEYGAVWYPRCLINQINLVTRILNKCVTTPKFVYETITKPALTESPRDDYSYRVFTESGTFVTNSVLCKTER